MAKAADALMRVIGSTSGRTGEDARRELTSLVSSRDRAKQAAEAIESAPAKAVEDVTHVVGVIARAGMDRAAEALGVLEYANVGNPLLAAAGYGGGWLTGSKALRRTALSYGFIDLYRAVAGTEVAKASGRIALKDELAALEASATPNPA